MFFNDTATAEIYTLSLHDALPISRHYHCQPLPPGHPARPAGCYTQVHTELTTRLRTARNCRMPCRSEEHTSELQSRQYLVCRLLLEKKMSLFRQRPA